MNKSKEILKVIGLIFAIVFISSQLFALSASQTHADAMDVIKEIDVGVHPDEADDPVETYVISNVNYGIGFTGMLSVIYVVVGAVRYIMAGGDEQKLQDAWKTIQNALIGLVLIVLAGLIINFVLAVVTGNVGTEQPTPAGHEYFKDYAN